MISHNVPTLLYLFFDVKMLTINFADSMNLQDLVNVTTGFHYVNKSEILQKGIEAVNNKVPL